MSLKIQKNDTNNLKVIYPDNNKPIKSLPIAKILDADSSLKRTGQKISFYIKKFLSEISCGMIFRKEKNYKLLKHIHFDSSNKKSINYYIINLAKSDKLENYNYDDTDALIKKSERVKKLAKYAFGSIRTTSNPTDYDVIVTFDIVVKKGQRSTKNAAIKSNEQLNQKRQTIDQKINDLNEKIKDLNTKISGPNNILFEGNYIRQLMLSLGSINNLEELNEIEKEIDKLLDMINSYRNHVIEREIEKFKEAYQSLELLPQTISEYQSEKDLQSDKLQNILDNGITIKSERKPNWRDCFKTKKQKEKEESQKLKEQENDEINKLETNINQLDQKISQLKTDLEEKRKIVEGFFGEQLNVSIQNLEDKFNLKS